MPIFTVILVQTPSRTLWGSSAGSSSKKRYGSDSVIILGYLFWQNAIINNVLILHYLDEEVTVICLPQHPDYFNVQSWRTTCCTHGWTSGLHGVVKSVDSVMQILCKHWNKMQNPKSSSVNSDIWNLFLHLPSQTCSKQPLPWQPNLDSPKKTHRIILLQVRFYTTENSRLATTVSQNLLS